MGQKTELLASILDSLEPEEASVIEKTAGAKTGLGGNKKVGLEQMPAKNNVMAGLSSIDNIHSFAAEGDFQKTASSNVLGALYEAAGVDLEKVASESLQEDILLKVASDTLEEFGDLEKTAQLLAENAADIFLAQIAKAG